MTPDVYRDLLKAVECYLVKADDELADRLQDEGYIMPEETVDAINTLEDGLSDILTEQKKYITAGLLGGNTIGTLQAEDLAREKSEALISGELNRGMFNLSDQYIKSYDPKLSLNRLSNRSRAWVEDWSKQLAKYMDLDTYRNVERILNKTLEGSYTVVDATTEMMDAYCFSRSRARTFAITEQLTLHSYSSWEAMLQSPVVDRKRWRHTGAQRTEPRPHHVALDGVTVGKLEKFIVNAPDGDYEADCPRDINLPASERIHCHCFQEAVVDDSVFGLTLEERLQLQQQAIENDDAEWEKELDARNRAAAGIE